MAFVIEPIQAADTEELISLHGAAYKGDALLEAVIPPEKTIEQRAEFHAWQVDRHYECVRMPNTHFFKAVDQHTGRIAGYAAWTGPTPEEYANQPSEADAPFPLMPSFIDVAVLRDAETKLEVGKKKALGGIKDFWSKRSSSILLVICGSIKLSLF